MKNQRWFWDLELSSKKYDKSKSWKSTFKWEKNNLEGKSVKKYRGIKKSEWKKNRSKWKKLLLVTKSVSLHGKDELKIASKKLCCKMKWIKMENVEENDQIRWKKNQISVLRTESNEMNVSWVVAKDALRRRRIEEEEKKKKTVSRCEKSSKIPSWKENRKKNLQLKIVSTFNVTKKWGK